MAVPLAICVDELNPAAFMLPRARSDGDAGRGTVRGPDQITIGAGLFKQIPFGAERLKFRF